MKKITQIFTAIAIMIGLAAITTFAAHAEDVSQLQISPTRSGTFELKSGETKSGSFQVKNTGNTTFDFVIKITPLTAKNDTYSYDYATETNYTKLSKWITYSSEKTTLEPGEATQLNYTITVPEDAPGGSQHAAITAAIASDSNGTINIVSRAAYLVYANVEGDIRFEGDVIENNIPGFVLSSPVTASSLVENTGNIDFNAKYNFEVMEPFSDHEIYSNTDDDVQHIVMPDTKRFINFTWEGSPQLGLFRVRQTVTVGDKVSVNEKLVFVCPIWLLFLILLLIFLMIIWLIVRSRSRRRQQA